MSDVLVCSFFTPGGYYEECAEQLKADVEALGLSLHLKRMVVPADKTWPQICRLKVPFVQDVRRANPGKLLFWIDVDCRLRALPDFIKDSTADIIGFQRGFGPPLSIGYANKARFWEPCFFGFGRSEAATDFIDFAAAAERRAEFDATDDYFFEEAWRAQAPKLTYQFIPSEMAKPTHPQNFFTFGSSSNVAKYQGKVRQHHAPPGQGIISPTRMKSGLRSLALRHLPEPAIQAIVGLRAKQRETRAKATIESMVRDGLTPDGAAKERPQQMEAFTVLVKQSFAATQQPLLDRVNKVASVLGASAPDVVKTLDWGHAFQDFRHPPTADNAINLMWWDTPSPGNYGDWLSPYVFGAAGRAAIKYAKPGTSLSEPHVLGLGSIAKFAQSNTTVMGAGIADRGTKLNPQANYVFVRGRHTADCISASGGRAPELFGDPAIILRRIFAPSIAKEPGATALVRHIRHRPLDMKLPSHMEEIDIWAARPRALERFISRLLTKEFVVTSAMHCFITCQSYGVPCALVTFEGLEDVVPGDGVKYLDYLSGVEMPEVPPHLLPTDLRSIDLHNFVRTDRVSETQIDDVFSAIAGQISSLSGK